MRATVALLSKSFIAALAASGGSAAAPIPSLLTQHSSPQFAVRPAYVIFTGDGSQVMGGLDGTGVTRSGPFGHIDWRTWSSTQAIGYAAAWDRCDDYRGCTNAYLLDSRHLARIRASKPVKGRFTYVVVGWSCWRLRHVPDRYHSYYDFETVNCSQ